MKKQNHAINQKGEGELGLILLIAFFAAIGYFGYKYFWPADKPAVAAEKKALDPRGGSLAGQQVQGAQAAGELLGSGR